MVVGAAVVGGAAVVVVRGAVVVVACPAVVVGPVGAPVVEDPPARVVVVVDRRPARFWLRTRLPKSVSGNSHASSSSVASIMNCRQIFAGNVPPETSSPLNSSIGSGCS